MHNAGRGKMGMDAKVNNLSFTTVVKALYDFCQDSVRAA